MVMMLCASEVALVPENVPYPGKMSEDVHPVTHMLP